MSIADNARTQEESPGSPPEGDRQLHIWEPRRGWRSRLQIVEIWAYRELLYYKTRRAITVRYKQTALGPSWAIIRPTMTMIVFTILFGTVARLPTDDIPGPVFYYSALLPWTFFAGALTTAATSLTAGGGIIRKVYFPRPIEPLSLALTHLVDFGISFFMLAALMAYYRVVPTAWALVLPGLVLLALITALGVGMWLAPLNALYRDVGHAAGTITTLWMYAAPVIYPASEIRERLGEGWLTLYFLNPMTGVIEGFRWGLTGQGTFTLSLVAPSIGIALMLLLSGLWFFRRLEAKVVDVL